MSYDNYRQPWSVRHHSDPLTSILYLIDADGTEIATFYGQFEQSASAIKLILEKCNPPAVQEEVAAARP